jgi:hypothetical protein
VLLASVTSQMSVWSRISLSWIGGAAWRMALVTSSLTTSSVVNSASASPHVRSWSVASWRARATMAGSAGMSQVATLLAGSARVRTSIMAASSAGRSVRMASITASPAASSDIAGTASTWHIRARPWSMSRWRDSIRPSVNRARMLPGGRSSSVVSKGMPPTPSSGPMRSEATCAAPPPVTRTGRGWPAVARVQWREIGS